MWNLGCSAVSPRILTFPGCAWWSPLYQDLPSCLLKHWGGKVGFSFTKSLYGKWLRYRQQMDLEIGKNTANVLGNRQKVMADFSKFFLRLCCWYVVLHGCFPTCEISDFSSCKAFQALVRLLSKKLKCEKEFSLYLHQVAKQMASTSFHSLPSEVKRSVSLRFGSTLNLEFDPFQSTHWGWALPRIAQILPISGLVSSGPFLLRYCCADQ